MKTTFSYFQGMFENPAPAKIIFKRQNQNFDDNPFNINLPYLFDALLGSNECQFG